MTWADILVKEDGRGQPTATNRRSAAER
jgi:hypothetical protein